MLDWLLHGSVFTVQRPLAARAPGAATAALLAVDTEAGRNVVDLAFIDDQRSTFGEVRLRRFLALLRDELSRRRTALEAAACQGDRAGLALHAHAVASAAGNLGFHSLLELGRRLESEIPTLPDREVQPALDRLYAAIDVAGTAITTLDIDLADGRSWRRAAG